VTNNEAKPIKPFQSFVFSFYVFINFCLISNKLFYNICILKPFVILLLAIWPNPDPGALYGLALLSTLSGNLLLTGSLANIITAERAVAAGSRFGFADHARAGIPMTLISVLMAALWLAFMGWMPWR